MKKDILSKFGFVILSMVLTLVRIAWGNQDSTTQAEEHLKKGKEYFHHQDYQKAINEYASATKLDKNNFKAYELMGYAYLKNGDTKEAVQLIKHSIALNPRSIM